jgi:hypothetical protein
LNIQKVLSQWGEFSWSAGSEFFIETKIGNFIWYNPLLGGTNIIHPISLTLKEYIKGEGGFVRGKGKHCIREYCGENIIFKGDYLNESIQKF